MTRFAFVSAERERPAWVESLVGAFSDAEPGLAYARNEVGRAWSSLPVARHPGAAVSVARRHWLLDPALASLRHDLERLGFEVEGSPPEAPAFLGVGPEEVEWQLDPERLGWKPRRPQLLRRYQTSFGVEVDAYDSATSVAVVIEWDAFGRTWASPGYPWRRPPMLGIDAEWLVCASPLYEKTLAPLDEVWSPERVTTLGAAFRLRGTLVIDA